MKGIRIQLFLSSVSGKYLRNCAPNSLRCIAISHLTLSASLSSFAHKKNHTIHLTCMLSLLMQTEKSSNFLIIASNVSHTESPCNPRFRSFRRKYITQIGQSCEKLVIKQVKIMVSKENFKLVSQFKKMCKYFAP